jgi:hypothetical protein
VKWLVALVKGIVSALLEWGQGKAEKLKTITEADTPKEMRQKYERAFKDWQSRRK